jgi:hypothetical protein
LDLHKYTARIYYGSLDLPKPGKTIIASPGVVPFFGAANAASGIRATLEYAEDIKN